MSAAKNEPNDRHSYWAKVPLSKFGNGRGYFRIARPRGDKQLLVGPQVGTTLDVAFFLTLDEARDLGEMLLEAAHVEETDDQVDAAETSP